MKTLCPKCSSNNIIPLAEYQVSTTQPPSLLSAGGLAGIGATICKSYRFPPVIGIVAGTLAGIAISYLQDTQGQSNSNHYCCLNCRYTFKATYPISALS